MFLRISTPKLNPQKPVLLHARVRQDSGPRGHREGPHAGALPLPARHRRRSRRSAGEPARDPESPFAGQMNAVQTLFR